jgi:hypothetical protein
MEPVILPKVIAPVTNSDRVKRAKPRGDSGGGSAFGRYLRPSKTPPPDGPVAAPEDSPGASDPDGAEGAAEHGGPTRKKLIDIRV